MYQQFIAKFTNTSFIIILVLCAVLPFFFLPASIGGLGAIKGVVLYSFVFLAFSLWLVAQFIDGSLKFPRHKALIALGAWVGLSLVSALASQNIAVSLWGRGFVIDSFATTLVFGIFIFLVAAFSSDQRKLIKLFLATYSGSVITLVLQVVLYGLKNVPVVAKYLGHVSSQGTLVGSWIDFAYFVTFLFILSLLMVEVLIPKGFFKKLSIFAMILSLVVMIFINFKAVWIIAIIASLFVFVYKSSVERSLARRDISEEVAPEDSEEPRRFPIMSFIALLIGLFFFLGSATFGTFFARYAGVSFTDIRPSFSTTTHVMRAALAKDPILGAGAGRYAEVWNLYHPVEINQTVFWNTSFDTGYSMLQSLFTTNGIFPTLAFVVLLVLSVITGFRLFTYQFPDRFSRFIAVTSFIILIAFVLLLVLTSPGIILIMLGFTYIGLLLGVSTLVGRTDMRSINYLKDPRISFFSILILVVAALLGFSAVYFSGNRFASIVLYNRALAAPDAAAASRKLDAALSLSQNDIYWRTRTALFTTQFSEQAAKQNPDKAQLQTLFSQSEQSASGAVGWDPTSANNWLMLSQVYQLVASSDNADIYANAKKAADEAQTRNPNNPLFALNQAQLALTQKNTDEAFRQITNAINLKSNYLDAYILRAQVKASEGDTGAAKAELTAYIKAAPYDDQGYTLLGTVLLNAKDYTGAVAAFSQAKELNPGNPNNYIQYIGALELSGNRSKAVTELQYFKTLFPNITGVDDQIKRIQTQANQPVSLPTVQTTPVAPSATPVSASKKTNR